MSISGSCFCGRITYEVNAPLENARCCHCSRCRKAFGGPSSAYAEVRAGSFKWKTGQADLKRFSVDGKWGLAFCAKCGSALAGILDDAIHGVTLGSVDGDPGVEIAMHIHVASKAPWDHIGGAAPQFLEGPESDDTT